MMKNWLVKKGFLATLPDNALTRLQKWACTHPEDPLSKDIVEYMEYELHQTKELLDLVEGNQDYLTKYRESVSEVLESLTRDGRLIPLCKQFTFKPSNGGWTIGAPGKKSVFLYSTKGLQHIHKLLSKPGEPIPCLELIRDDLPHPDNISLPEDEDGYDYSDFSENERKKGSTGAGEDLQVTDAKTVADTKDRYQKLDELKRSALADNNEDLAAKHEEEQDKITQYLAKNTGKGRIRKEGPGEKARQNVKKAIDAALDKIRGECPAAHKALKITTGHSCAYIDSEEWDT